VPPGAFLAKLTEVRLLIEPGAAEQAARRARPAQIAALQAALRDMREALDLSPPDYAAYNEADVRFHRTIVQAPATTRCSSRWARS
jgi:DNA-binding FadR family transcriptional regulator